MSKSISKPRKDWVDFLRGIAMLFVVIGHLIPDDFYYFVITSPVKMPLFFAISGYLFVNKDILSFTNKITKQLIIPWLCLGMAPVLLQTPFLGIDYAVNYLYNMLSGKELWFMPCFIISSCLFFVLFRMFHDIGFLGIVSFVMFLVGVFLRKNNILNFAMINIAMTVQIFLWGGHAFRRYEPYLLSLSLFKQIRLVSIFLYFFFIALSLYFFSGMSLDVHLAFYYNLILCLLLIVTGLFALFSYFSDTRIHYPNFMLQIGKHSLIIYIYHYYIIIFMRKLIEVLPFNMPLFLYVIINTIMSCFVCVIISKLLSRYLPVVVGYR